MIRTRFFVFKTLLLCAVPALMAGEPQQGTTATPPQKITIVDPAGRTPGGVRISMSDFEVKSANPQLEHIGKGFTEFISIDLAKSKQLTLIDREKRIDLLKEQAFALSGAADEKSRIAIGKLLSADFLITGNIFDLLDNLTLTFRISDATTGEIVFEDKVTDKLSKYDRISSAAAEKILTYLKIQLPKDLIARANMPQEERSPQVAIKFSRAVDAYDKKNYQKAETELRAAQALDPENTAVNVYLDKLFVNTTKFKVMPEFYVSYQNPAYLGLLKQDKAYLTFSSMGKDEIVRSLEAGVVEKADKFGAGYYRPLSVVQGLGVGVEWTSFHTKDMIYGAGPTAQMVLANNQVSYMGIVLSAGLQLSDNMSVGAGYTLYNKDRNYYIGGQLAAGGINPYHPADDAYIDKKTSGLGAASLGLLLKNSDNTLFLDSYYAATSEKTEYYSLSGPLAGSFVGYKMPATLETTLSWAFNQRRTFAVLKQTNYLYSSGMDTSRWSITPAIEHWFSGRFAVRAGTEYSQLTLDGRKQAPGNGYTAGATWSFKKLDIDLNYTNRARPSRNLNSVMVKEKVIFLTLSTNSGIFAKSGN